MPRSCQRFVMRASCIKPRAGSSERPRGRGTPTPRRGPTQRIVRQGRRRLDGGEGLHPEDEDHRDRITVRSGTTNAPKAVPPREMRPWRRRRTSSRRARAPEEAGGGWAGTACVTTKTRLRGLSTGAGPDRRAARAWWRGRTSSSLTQTLRPSGLAALPGSQVSTTVPAGPPSLRRSACEPTGRSRREPSRASSKVLRKASRARGGR